MKKTYKAVIRTEVNMTKEEYIKHLQSQRDMYLRLVDNENESLRRTTDRRHKNIREYNQKISDIVSEISRLAKA